MRRLRDCGEGSVSYLVVVLLIAAITAAAVVSAVPGTVSGGVQTAVCKVIGQDCHKGTSAPQAAGAPGSGRPSTGATSDPSGSDPNDPYNNPDYKKAKSRADAADSAASSAETDWSGLSKELLSFLADLVGITDAKNCITKGDIMGCLMTLVNVLPWGKIFKVLRKIPKAAKLISKFAKLLEKLTKARKEKEAADAALKKAEEDALRKAGEACAVPNSFVAGTPVLLADGRLRAIQDIRAGDQVLAGDPVTGETGPHSVAALITGFGTKQLVNLALGGPLSRPATLTATDNHPFWLPIAQRWVDASNLHPGDVLSSPAGPLGTRTGPTILEARHWTQTERVYNLSVVGIHTYYVEPTGASAVLVHNMPRFCGLRVDVVAQDWESKGLHVHMPGSGKEVSFYAEATTDAKGVTSYTIKVRSSYNSAEKAASAKDLKLAMEELKSPAFIANILDRGAAGLKFLEENHPKSGQIEGLRNLLAALGKAG